MKLLPWGAGFAALLAILAFSFSAGAAPASGSGPAVAPAAVMAALNSATYEESPSKGDAHVVFAETMADPLGDPYTAKAWVRVEQTHDRVVFCTTSVLEELATSSAPLYSFPADKIPGYVSKSSTFYRLPAT